MTRDDLDLTIHAAARMAERNIAVEAIIGVLSNGEIIESYPDDTPLPSRLQLAWIADRPLHVVSAPDSDRFIVITVYEPNPAEWTPDFRRRLK